LITTDPRNGRALAQRVWLGAIVTNREQGRRAIHHNYMKLMDLQKLDKAVELLGSRHYHRTAVATNLSTFGVIPLKITSWRCFHSSQQHKRRKLEAASLGTWSGILVSQRL